MNSELNKNIEESIENEYIFSPTQENNGIIDYTGVEADKIYLASKKIILSQELPSYLPPVEIRRDTQYDIPAYKVKDNEYLLKESDVVLKRDGSEKLREPRIYRVSLDVYAALLNYHLEYDRAAFIALAKRNEENRLSALENGEKNFSYVNENTIPVIPGRLDINSLSEKSTSHYVQVECNPSRVSLKSTKSNRMNVEPYYYIQKMSNNDNKPLKRNEIFRMHRECLDDVKQKLLDMELQKADFESSWAKGRETAYGDSNLDNSLVAELGITVKRQNGDIITAKEIDEVKATIERVHSVYGNISGAAREFGLKVSHAGNMHMHASKYVGLFSSYQKAIGFSFADGLSQASLTASHEYAHFLDHLSGRDAHAWHASDIPGTLENIIAVTFREKMNPAKGEYWNRTCECFARAMEEYTQISMLREENNVLSDEDMNKHVSKAAYVNYRVFEEHIAPLAKKLVEQYQERFTTETEKSIPLIKREQKVATAAAVTRTSSEKTDKNQREGRSYIQLELFEPTSEYLSREHEFYRQIDDYLVNGIAPKNNEFVLTQTPEVLQYTGIGDDQIILRVSTLKQARNLHRLSNDEIRQSLQSLSDPVFVFDSNKETKGAIQDRILILTDTIKGNKPIAIAVELEKETSKRIINEIRSIHDRELIARNGVNALEEWAKKGLLKYVDDKKISDWQRREQAQFKLFFAEPDKSVLLDFDSLVNSLSGDKVKTKTGYISETIAEHPETTYTETDPALTRDHIRAAKSAMRTYVNPVLKGEKSGLWKSFQNLKAQGVFSIVGASVETDTVGRITGNGWKQLYQALNIYRDKRFETFRVLFVTPDGVINDQLAISSHMPNRVSIKPILEQKESIIDHAERTNTNIVVVHNHPSGSIQQSIEDENITDTLNKSLTTDTGRNLLQGHIILDHYSFGLWERNTGWNSVVNNFEQTYDPLMKKRNPDFTQTKITNANLLCRVAQQVNESERWNSTDWVPVLFANSSAKISGVRYFSKEWFVNTSSEKVIAEFQSVGIKTGAIWAFPVINEELAQDEALRDSIHKHMKNGCFRDYYMAGETSENHGLDTYGSSIYSGLSSEDVHNRTIVESTVELERSIFSGNAEKPAAYNKIISTKSEIVKVFSVQDEISKYNQQEGKAMVDEREENRAEYETQEQSLTPSKPFIQLNAERFLEVIKNESAPFLTRNGDNFVVSITPQAIRSAETGKLFVGMKQLQAQIDLKEMGNTDTELITYEQTKRHKAGIKKGSQGLNLINYNVESKAQTVYRYYPKSAVNSRERLPQIPPQPVNSNTVISCNDSNVEKYLGKYLAATSSSARFETTRDTMNAFKKNLVSDLEKAFSEKRYSRIFEIGNKAGEISRNSMKEIGSKAQAKERLKETKKVVTQEPYNPVTGEKFVGRKSTEAKYFMEKRQSKDPRFLEMPDILKAGLSLKKDCKESLVISVNGKSRVFYNAVDIEGMPPKANSTERTPVQRKIPLARKNTEMDIGL
jgi:hypothetical protein